MICNKIDRLTDLWVRVNKPEFKNFSFAQTDSSVSAATVHVPQKVQNLGIRS